MQMNEEGEKILRVILITAEKAKPPSSFFFFKARTELQCLETDLSFLLLSGPIIIIFILCFLN